MLGKRDPQRKLFTTNTLIGEEALAKMGFHGVLAREGHRLFRDEDFAAIYSKETGRPSVPPSVLALATLLQYFDKVSDAEVVERCRYDLRWKAALHLDLHSIDAPFAKSTFQGFRLRLTLHEKEGLLFENSVKAAVEAGLVPKRLRIAVDSSPIRGRGAVKDTFNLLSDAIRGVIGKVARDAGQDAEAVAESRGLVRHVTGKSIKGSSEVDWQDKVEVDRFLAELLADCEKAVGLAEEAGCAGEEVSLLLRVTDQDIDPDGPNGGPTIRRGVARERMPSVADPEMRHGRKSSGTTYDGHKAHVAVESESGIVTSVDVTAPSEPEGGCFGDLVEETEELTGSVVEEALGDSAYGTARTISEANRRKIQLVTKMPKKGKRGFAPGDFVVSEDGRHGVCPAGVASARAHKLGDGTVLKWSPADCGACRHQAKCTRGKARELRVGPGFHDRRKRESYAWSEDGRRKLRERIRVEHAIGRLKRKGAGRSRFFGRAKTKYQLLMTAAVVNLSLVFNRVAGEHPARKAA